MNDTSSSSRISPLEKIGYGLGDTASNIVFQTVMMLLAYFYTDIFGISATAMGTLFLAVRCLDAVTDPLMGAVCDRTQTHWGKFRPYILLLSVPFAAICVITFTTPDLSPVGKLIYAYVTYSLLMIIYTAINIPYCALGGVITPDSRQRVSLQSYRFFLASAGGVLVTAGTLPMVKALGQGNEQKGYQLAMVCFGLLAIVLFVACFFMTRERVVSATPRQGTFKKDLQHLFRNDQWVVVMLINFFLLVPLVIRSSAAAYYMKWYAGKENLITPFLVTGTVAMMLGAGCSDFLARRLPKVKAYVFVQVMVFTTSAGMYFIPAHGLAAMFVVYAIVQFFTQMGSPILWAMMSDAVDYGEHKTGRRVTALSFSGSLFSLKLGVALGGAMFGWLLGYFGYREAGTEPLAQTSQAIGGIVLLFTVIPAVWHLLVAGVALRYRLSDERCARIRRELDQRAGQSQAVSH